MPNIPTQTGGDNTAIQERKKRTFYLLIGGIFSLLIPALWLLYSKLSEAPSSSGAVSSTEIFSKRGSDGNMAAKITPSEVAAAPGYSAAAMPGNSSLTAPAGTAAAAATAAPAAPPPAGAVQGPSDSMSFLRGGQDYAEKQAAPPQQPTPPPQQAQQPKTPPPAPVQTAQQTPPPAAPAKKPFNMPKLSGWKGGGLSGFGNKGGQQQQAPQGQPQMTPQQMQMMQQMMAAQKGGGGQAAGGMGGLQGGGTGGLKGLNKGGGQQQQGAPQMPAGMPPGMDMGALMKNLPPGTQLPTGQAGPASIGGGGTPDMSKLMQNLPQQNTGGGPMPGLGDQSQQGH